jgi:hypothetical protein
MLKITSELESNPNNIIIIDCMMEDTPYVILSGDKAGHVVMYINEEYVVFTTDGIYIQGNSPTFRALTVEPCSIEITLKR